MRKEINQETALYDLIDSDDNILYVGISINPIARFHSHKREERITGEYYVSVVNWFRSKSIARASEIMRIKELNPPFNMQSRTDIRGGRNKEWDRKLAARMIGEGVEIKHIAIACDVSRNTITYNFYDELYERRMKQLNATK